MAFLQQNKDTLDFLAIPLPLKAFETKVYVMGQGDQGQLTSAFTHSDFPVLLSTLTSLKPINISCGGNHSAILSSEGQVYIFGSYKGGDFGYLSNITYPDPTFLIGRCSDVSCGGSHTVVLTQKGDVCVSGSNQKGQLGLGDTKDRWGLELLPRFIPGPEDGQGGEEEGLEREGEKCVVVSCGWEHTAILTSEGRVFVFGDNEEGQLGLGDTDNRLVPTLIPNLPRCIAMSCGCRHTILLTADGQVYGMGSNEDRQLGFSNERNISRPERLRFPPPHILPPVISVSCGVRHTAVLTHDGKVYTFGLGREGRLGTESNEWGHISNIPPCAAISCGYHHTLILTREGRVYTFGWNVRGQLGVGDRRHRVTPTLLANLPPCISISGGGVHSGLICV